MNQKDDDKATAALLLSTDEAVAEKLRRVLMNHPDLMRDAIKNMQMDDERITQQIRNQMYQQSVAQQTAYQQQAYASNLGNSMQNTKNQLAGGLLNNIFGGKK